MYVKQRSHSFFKHTALDERKKTVESDNGGFNFLYDHLPENFINVSGNDVRLLDCIQKVFHGQKKTREFIKLSSHIQE